MQIAGGAVDIDRGTIRRHTGALVYVPKRMHRRPHPCLDLVQEIDAPRAHPTAAEVAVTQWRAVRQEHIGVLGDQLPLLAAWRAAR